MSQTINNNPSPSFQTIKGFAKKHDCFSEGSLRWMIFNSEQNGLSPAVIHIGRRVLIDEAKFFSWIQSQQESRKS